MTIVLSGAEKIAKIELVGDTISPTLPDCRYALRKAVVPRLSKTDPERQDGLFSLWDALFLLWDGF
ncbi:MAG: hypothetical protein IPG67_18830 [Acidobacteria bacterium]|nr:hypothetical protein [Acidobacteriota bacterium]